MRVALMEYYPFDFVDRDSTMSVKPKSDRHRQTFQWGRANFLQEARTLAQFEHPAIVRVSRVFEANSTAYMVMRFEQGLNYEHWLRQLGRPPTQQELDAILRPLLEALQMMHRANFLHRDISPDNIIVRGDGSPVLLDFCAARRAVAEMSHSLTGIVKPGYSPHEQYTSDSRLQGPWTDLYALGGTLYRAIAGVPPEEATLRVDEDRMPPAIQIAQGKYRKEFLNAIDACLKVRGSERPQSVTEVRSRLLGDELQPRSGLAPVSRPVTKPQQPKRRISTARRSSIRLSPAIVAAIVAVSGGVYGGFEFTRWQSEQQSAWKARQPAAEAAQRQASLEADRRLKDEQARTTAEARRRVEEAQRKAAEDARREAEREAQRRQAEDQERARIAAEAQRRAQEAQRKAAEDARREEVEREAQRRQAEEQEKARAAAEAQRRAEEAQQKAAEDARREVEREAQRRQAEEQDKTRKAAEEREAEARRRAEADARAAEVARRVQAEEEGARRQTQDRIADAEQKEKQRLAAAPSDGERTAFVRRIQRVLQKASCYDGALNGRSEDAQKGINHLIESSKGPRKPTRIELAKATVGDFESWLRSADEIIDGEICPPPKPSSPPARHATSTPRHRDEGASRGSRQPWPNITRETRPAREWGGYSGGSSGGTSIIQGVRP